MAGFTSMIKNIRDRNFGGSYANIVAEPYVSGYAYTKWTVPSTITNNKSLGGVFGFDGSTSNVSNDSANKNALANITNILSATCISVTPPDGRIETVEFNAIGGAKYYVPGAVTYGNTLQCRFVEFSGLPVFTCLHKWCQLIRNNKTGTTLLGATTSGGGEYSKENYAGTCLYWTTKPDGRTVEYAAAYSGVFPTQDPVEQFTGDIATIEKLELDIAFSVDFVYTDTWVYQAAQKAADSLSYANGVWTGSRQTDPAVVADKKLFD